MSTVSHGRETVSTLSRIACLLIAIVLAYPHVSAAQTTASTAPQ